MIASYFLSIFLFLISADGILCQHPPVTQFRVIRQWKYFNFTWPNEESYLSAIENHRYIPKNIILKRVKFYEDWYYLTLPRMKAGIPATLVRVPGDVSRGTKPPLEPYPSWEMNKEGDCNALQNVQSIEIDDKGRMWIIDLGSTNILERTPSNMCPPKLVIQDVNNNSTILSYTFPEEVVASGSFLYDLVVDNDFAYITDNSAENPGIVVFSLKDQDSWKIIHAQSMTADPKAREFRLNGVIITHPINIAPIALGPRLRVSNGRVVLSDDRDVFYSPFSSFHLYSLSTDTLRDKRNQGNYGGIARDWGTKASQSDSMIMDNQGILYYSLLADNSIGLWDSRTSFGSGQKIIARDNNYIQWISAFSFDNLGNLTVASTRMQNLIAYGEFNISENNFWLLSAHNGGRSYVYDFNEYLPLPTTSPEYDGTLADGKLEVNPNVTIKSTSPSIPTSFMSSTTMKTTTLGSMSSANETYSTKNATENETGSVGKENSSSASLKVVQVLWGCILLMVFSCYINLL